MCSSHGSYTTSAPAKIILFGEHAVVYGKPALAVPILTLRVTVTATPDASTTFVAGDWSRRFPADIASEMLTDPVFKMAQLTATLLNVPIPMARYEISSAIPVASGLGSGAAVSAAVGRAVAAAAGRSISNDKLNQLVYEIERIHHGTPSGIDNTVIVYEQPVYFVRGEAPQTFNVKSPLRMLIADTGRSALTKESVGDVRQLTKTRPEFALPRLNEIGQIADAARAAISSGDDAQVGHLMNRSQALLQDLTVSSPELDNLVSEALKAGALGAKLSGGGRGGNMIALVTPVTETAVRDALITGGAVRVIATTVI